MKKQKQTFFLERFSGWIAANDLRTLFRHMWTSDLLIITRFWKSSCLKKDPEMYRNRKNVNHTETCQKLTFLYDLYSFHWMQHDCLIITDSAVHWYQQ